MSTQSSLVKDLFKNGVHIGHRTQKWNPRMKKYLYGDRDGVHIINLEKTVECMDKALRELNKIVSEGKTVLFVSTKPQSQKLIESLAQSANMPYVQYSSFPSGRDRLRSAFLKFQAARRYQKSSWNLSFANFATAGSLIPGEECKADTHSRNHQPP